MFFTFSKEDTLVKAKERRTLARQKETLARQEETLARQKETLARQKETLARQEETQRELESLKKQLEALKKPELELEEQMRKKKLEQEIEKQRLEILRELAQEIEKQIQAIEPNKFLGLEQLCQGLEKLKKLNQDRNQGLEMLNQKIADIKLRVQELEQELKWLERKLEQLEQELEQLRQELERLEQELKRLEQELKQRERETEKQACQKETYEKFFITEKGFSTLTLHISCSSDQLLASNPKGLTGLIFYSYKGQKDWCINGYHMKTGYLIFKDPSKLPGYLEHTDHQTVFEWVTGTRLDQNTQKDFDISGCAIKTIPAGTSSWLQYLGICRAGIIGEFTVGSSTFNTCTNKPGWDDTRNMYETESNATYHAVECLKDYLGIQELRCSDRIPKLGNSKSITAAKVNSQTAHITITEYAKINLEL